MARVRSRHYRMGYIPLGGRFFCSYHGFWSTVASSAKFTVWAFEREYSGGTLDAVRRREVKLSEVLLGILSNIISGVLKGYLFTNLPEPDIYVYATHR